LRPYTDLNVCKGEVERVERSDMPATRIHQRWPFSARTRAETGARLEVGRNFYGIHMKFDQRIAG